MYLIMVVLFYSLFVVIYQSLAVIGGGTVGLSVASCMKELGCDRVTIIERNLHCLMDMNDMDKEIAAYIESTLIKQQIDIVTNCFVNYLTETAVHSITDPIKLIKSSNTFELIWLYDTTLEPIIDLLLLVQDED